jgi:hypothetical protein
MQIMPFLEVKAMITMLITGNLLDLLNTSDIP